MAKDASGRPFDPVCRSRGAYRHLLGDGHAVLPRNANANAVAGLQNSLIALPQAAMVQKPTASVSSPWKW